MFRYEASVVPYNMFCETDDTGLLSQKNSEKQRSKVKPRTVWDKPDITELTEKSCVLKWKPSSVPDYAMKTPIWYILEQRTPPNLEWVRIDSEIKVSECKVLQT